MLGLILLFGINIIVLNSTYFNEIRILKSETIQQFINEKVSSVEVVEDKEALKKKILDFYYDGLLPEVIKMNNINEKILFFNLCAFGLLLFLWGLNYMYLKFKENQIRLISRIVFMISIIWLLLCIVNNISFLTYSRDLEDVILYGFIPVFLINFSLWILKKNIQEKKELE